MQTVLQGHRNLGMVLIPMCKNNLNLQIWSFFPALCLVASSPCSSCCHACNYAVPCWFVLVFTEGCIYVKAGIHSSYFQMRKISLNMSAWFTYKLYQHDFRIMPTYVFLYWDIFHWRLKTDYKTTSCEGHELWKLWIVNLSQLRTTYCPPTQTIML